MFYAKFRYSILLGNDVVCLTTFLNWMSSSLNYATSFERTHFMNFYP